jgi:hypothetical protein
MTTLSNKEFFTVLKERSEEKVSHPAHYQAIPATCDNCGKPIECIVVVRHCNFNRGNAIKYVWRAGAKDPATEIEDLRKAVFYLQDEIERLEGKKREG